MDKITRLVAGIIQEFLQEDIGSYRKSEFVKRSCMRWAAKEILKELEKQNLPPLIVLENFRDKMYEYSKLNSKSKWIFATGREAAEYFIGLLI